MICSGSAPVQEKIGGIQCSGKTNPQQVWYVDICCQRFYLVEAVKHDYNHNPQGNYINQSNVNHFEMEEEKAPAEI